MTAFGLLFLLAVTGLIAGAILYPDDPEGRAARVRRVIVAAAAHGIAVAGIGLLADLLQPGRSGLAFPLMSLGAAITWTAINLVLFGIAERIAGFAAPSRRLAWAPGAIAFCVGWTALPYAFLGEAGSIPALWFALRLGIPGLAGGLAWYALLPARPRPREIARLFE